jgi:hypothetical protein
MSRFDPSDRRSDDMINAVEVAAHQISHAIREGFKLVAAELKASHGSVDNSAAIEASAQKLKDLTNQINQTLPPPT